MRNYFIGIFPEKLVQKQVGLLTEQIKPVFNSQDIHVNWSKEENFHISIIFIGREINFIRKFLVKFALKRMSFQPFEISIDKVKLGISKTYRELIYLSIKDGADKLREELIRTTKGLGIKREQMFIPHITLGRVNKELTNEEFKNLSNQIERFNDEFEIDIKFIAVKPVFVESDTTQYKVIT